jgi:outer membrane protein insertion porin family
MQNIERMYHEAGYLFVQVKQAEDRSNSERLTYLVSIEEGERVKATSIKLLGNDHLSREELIASMIEMGMNDQVADLDPSYAVPARLEALRDSITSIYHHRGYPQAEITYSIAPLADSNSIEITFTIREGKAELSKIAEVIGYPSDLKCPTLPSGDTSIPRVNIFTDTILSSLRDEGYLNASIIVLPNADYTSVGLSIEPGIRTIVSNIKYEGLVAISLDTAKRSTLIKPSSPYRLADVSTTKKELLRTGLFSRVEVVAEDGSFDSASEGVIIRVVERPLQTLELGVGANSEFGLHTFGETANKSLFKDGRTLSMRVDTYFDQGRINPNGSGAISQGFTSVRYSDPKLFDSEYSLNEDLRYQRQELTTQEFNLDRLLLGSYLFRQIKSDLAMTAGHSLVLDNLQDVTPGAIISSLDDGSVILSFLSGVLKYDRRDDPLLPRRGYTFTLEPKIASQAIGSQADFFSISAKTTAIIPLFGITSRYPLGLGLAGAAAQPWGISDQIPITQRYYLGGRTSVRGFRENSLGPRGEDGAVIGGDTLIAGKTQLQYLAADSLSTHIFFDLGNVFLRDREFDPFDLRTSIGVGFQYLSPIGPIGFDVGSPLDERSGEPSVRVHFSVGSSF